MAKKFKMYSLRRKSTRKCNVEAKACAERDKEKLVGNGIKTVMPLTLSTQLTLQLVGKACRLSCFFEPTTNHSLWKCNPRSFVERSRTFPYSGLFRDMKDT